MTGKRTIAARQGGEFSPSPRAWRALARALAILTLLWQTLIPLQQSWAYGQWDFEEDRGDYLIICSAKGLIKIPLDPSANPEPAEQESDLSCPACSLVKALKAPLPVGDLSLDSAAASVPLLRPAFQTAPPVTDLRTPPVRGPPANQTI